MGRRHQLYHISHVRKHWERKILRLDEMDAFFYANDVEMATSKDKSTHMNESCGNDDS